MKPNIATGKENDTIKNGNLNMNIRMCMEDTANSTKVWSRQTLHIQPQDKTNLVLTCLFHLCNSSACN